MPGPPAVAPLAEEPERETSRQVETAIPPSARVRSFPVVERSRPFHNRQGHGAPRPSDAQSMAQTFERMLLDHYSPACVLAVNLYRPTRVAACTPDRLR